jgi:hypothetical protein
MNRLQRSQRLIEQMPVAWQFASIESRAFAGPLTNHERQMNNNYIRLLALLAVTIAMPAFGDAVMLEKPSEGQKQLKQGSAPATGQQKGAGKSDGAATKMFKEVDPSPQGRSDKQGSPALKAGPSPHMNPGAAK